MFLIDDAAVSLQRLICANAEKTHRFPISMGLAVPTAKLFSQVLLTHTVTVGGHGIMI